MRLIWLLCAIGTLAAADAQKACLVQLNSQSFSELVEKPGAVWFIHFYDDRSRMSTHMPSLWKMLGNTYCMNKTLQIAEVNLQTESEIKERFNITIVHRLWLFEQGTYREYKQLRSIPMLKKFIESDYLRAVANKIPPKKGVLGKFETNTEQQIAKFGKMLEQICITAGQLVGVYVKMLDDYGLARLPPRIKIVIVVFLFISPLALIPICILDICSKPIQQKKEEESKPMQQKKEEKGDESKAKPKLD